MTDENKTAMVLTQQEWKDLAGIVGIYLDHCEHVRGDPNMTVVTRRLELCDRIMDAVE